MKNIVFIAAPSAGKGTQAELIKKKYKIPHISTGDILREIAKTPSEIGNYVRETLKNGNLVKDEIAYQLIKERLAKKDCQNGYIIDGFPRNIEQAIEYDKILKELNYEIGNVILINISKETLQNRVIGRRVCEDCKKIYNINNLKESPHKESVCDKCGGALHQREDDNIKSFNIRYETYQEKTEDIIKYYKEKNVLYEVDGEKTKEELFESIEKIINRE